MQRHLLGLITLAFLLIAGLTHSFAQGESSWLMLGDACFRLAILLGVMWLALPNMLRLSEKLPGWLIGTTLLALATMAVRPKTIIFVAPLLLVVWVLARNWFGRKQD